MTAPGRAVELAHAAAMPAPQGGALPTAMEWQALERMAETLAGSSLVPYKLRGKPGDVAVILLAAREYGVPPLMALSKLPVVNGTPAPMGELMVALVLRAGHRITVDLEGIGGPWQEVKAVCRTRRVGDTEDNVLTFSFDEAVAAGLVELRDGKPYARKRKDNGSEEVLPWEAYTPNMLRWRAVANACRLRFPDVLLGLSYLPEELGATVDAEGRPILEGETVPAPRPAAPSIEQRTAQEAADRALAWEGDPAVLEGPVLTHAEENGYADVEVRVGSLTMPLREALAVRSAGLRERTVDPAPSTGQDEPTAPADAAPAPEVPPAVGEAQNGAQDAPLEAVLAGIVEEAASTDDLDVARHLYRENGPRGSDQLGADVTELLEPASADYRGDAAVLGLEPPVTLGAFLMAVAGRLSRGDGPLATQD